MMSQYQRRLDKEVEDVNDIIDDIIRTKENPEFVFNTCKSTWKFPDIGKNMINLMKIMIESKLFLDYGIYAVCKSTRRIRSTGDVEFKIFIYSDWSDVIPDELRVID